MLLTIWIRITLFGSLILPLALAYEMNIKGLLIGPSWYHNFWFLAFLLLFLSFGVLILAYWLLKPRNPIFKAVLDILGASTVIAGSFFLFAVYIIVNDLSLRANGQSGKFATNPAAEEYIGFLYHDVEKWVGDKKFTPR